jgi:hypothetical protein
MDESKRRTIQFLEKELKTYAALALFLSKKEIHERLRSGAGDAFLNPAYYKDRIDEAERLVNDLKKAN